MRRQRDQHPLLSRSATSREARQRVRGSLGRAAQPGRPVQGNVEGAVGEVTEYLYPINAAQERFVGATNGIGPALFAYLRMRSGADALKPDLRVRESLNRLGFGLPTTSTPSSSSPTRLLLNSASRDFSSTSCCGGLHRRDVGPDPPSEARHAASPAASSTPVEWLHDQNASMAGCVTAGQRWWLTPTRWCPAACS